MGYLLLLVILATLPLILSVLRSQPHRRPLAMTGIALALFLGSALRVDGTLISWPMWTGTSRGMQVSLVDTLALALILTRRPVPGRLPFWGLLGFYALPLALSLIPAAVPMASFFTCWNYARVVLVFAAVAGECHRDDMRRALLTGLALGLILQAGYVAQQKASGMVQAMGTMVHQNVLGLMTELALIPLLAALLGGDRRKIILAGVAAALIVVAGGGSRGTMGFAGGGAVVMILLSLIRGVTPAKMRVLGFAVLGLAVAAPIGFITLKDRFGNTSMTTQDDQRPAFERSARAMSADHPMGVGANLYVTTANLKGYADRAGVAWNFSNRSAPVHNAYLLARAETGWLGEIALILLIVIPMLRGLKIAFAHRQGMPGEVALGSAVAIGVNAIHNNYEFATHTYNVMALLIINIGFIAAQVRAAAQAKRQRPGPRPGSQSQSQSQGQGQGQGHRPGLAQAIQRA